MIAKSPGWAQVVLGNLRGVSTTTDLAVANSGTDIWYSRQQDLNQGPPDHWSESQATTVAPLVEVNATYLKLLRRLFPGEEVCPDVLFGRL
jgi:hypothetical protein